MSVTPTISALTATTPTASVGASSGDVNIGSDTVRTSGAFVGIDALSYSADVTVNSDYVSTQGNYSDGIIGETKFGDVTVNSGEVITHGAYSDGIHAYGYDGMASVNSDYVRTYGYRSTGIYAYGAGVTVDSGTVITGGLRRRHPRHRQLRHGRCDSSYVRTFGTGSWASTPTAISAGT